MIMNDKTKTLLRNILLFFVANFMPKAITFFMVPLYTYCLTTSEYGIIDLLTTTVQLLLPVLTLEVQDAMLRFSMDKNYNYNDVFTIGLRIACGGGVILLLLILAGYATEILNINPLYSLFVFISYLTGALKNICSYFCRGIDKIKIATISNIVLTLVTVIFNIIFLLKLKMGIEGYLLAVTIGNIIGVFILFFGARLYKYIYLNIKNKTTQKAIILFSIPMIFSALSWWINSSLDKYIVKMFLNTEAVGLLSVAYKIPSILSLFGTSIATAYSISAIKDFDKNDTDGFLGKSYSTINMLFVILCSLLMILNVFIAKILFSKDFFVAWQFVPPLLISSLMSQLSLMCQQYFIALKKPKIISCTAMVGAIINCICNFVLIYFYGIYGAAIATAFSFFVVWIIRYIILRKYIKLKHNFKKECFSYILLIIQMIFGYYKFRFIILQILIFTFVLLMYLKDIMLLINKSGNSVYMKD